jgi:hypothetical protein
MLPGIEGPTSAATSRFASRRRPSRDRSPTAGAWHAGCSLIRVAQVKERDGDDHLNPRGGDTPHFGKEVRSCGRHLAVCRDGRDTSGA